MSFPKVLRLKFGTGDEKGVYTVIGETGEPVYLIQDKEGHQFSWIKSLCEEVTPDEAIDHLYDESLTHWRAI